MALRKPRMIQFDDEMDKDMNEIKSHFKSNFGVEPSNRSIMNLLLQTYKEVNPNVRRKPKSRKGFTIKM